MAAPFLPFYRVIDRRGQSGPPPAAPWRGGSNQLFRAATPDRDRRQPTGLDNDVHRSISAYGRRALLGLGRWVYSNFGAVRGALHEKAEYASAVWLPQYRGANAAWGRAAEDWLWEHGKICDLAGWPYNARTWRRNLIVAVHRDGDVATLLTETPAGYPLLQTIPGHRIGSDPALEAVVGGEYDGAAIVDGVILNDYGAPIAYRVMTGRPFDYEQYADVSARDLMLSFIPQFVGQVRGFSTLGASLFDWQDIAETRQFELLAQKIGASIALLEKNETGEPPPGADFIIGPPAGTEAAGTATGVQQEILDGGVIRYLRARSGSNLEAFQQDRPTGNQIAFEANVIRSSFHGMDWSVDFSLDPTKVGGASMRVVIERINRAVAADQDLVLAPPTRRYDGYALAKAMKLGLLPWDDDWWRFEYQGPARLTADAKYDSDVQLQEVRAGVRSRARMAANLGEDLTDVRQIREREVNELLTAARRIADQHGIPLGTALALLESDNSLPVQSAPSPEAEPPARNEPAPARE